MANPYISSVSFGNQAPAPALGGPLQPQIDFNAYGMGGGNQGGTAQPQQSGGGVSSLLQNKAVNKLINKGLDKLLGGAVPSQTYGSLGALGGTPSGLGQFGSFGSAAAPETSAFGLGGGLSAPVATGSLTGLGGSLAPAAGPAGTYGSVGALGGTSSGLGQFGSLGGAAAPAEAAPASAGAANGSSAAMGAYAAPAALTAAWLYGLYRAIGSDQYDDSPIGQINAAAQSGAPGQALYNSMTGIASKYGDINNASTWDISKWSPADQFAVNYGNVGLTQPKHGKLLGN